MWSTQSVTTQSHDPLKSAAVTSHLWTGIWKTTTALTLAVAKDELTQRTIRRRPIRSRATPAITAPELETLAMLADDYFQCVLCRTYFRYQATSNDDESGPIRYSLPIRVFPYYEDFPFCSHRCARGFYYESPAIFKMFSRIYIWHMARL